MALQNRVTPFGEIVATSARGTIMGNRGGCFHKADRTLGASRWKSRAWLICRLRFKGRRRTVMTPNLYTELFFLDEASAISAGHRPCFECRRQAALTFINHWSAASASGDRPRAGDLDKVLHGDRISSGRQKRTIQLPFGDLPDGAMVARDGQALLKAGDGLLLWSELGYCNVLRPGGNDVLEVLTPATSLSILAAGYRPAVHFSAAKFLPQGLQTLAIGDLDDLAST
jgi:hypothetical protein